MTTDCLKKNESLFTTLRCGWKTERHAKGGRWGCAGEDLRVLLELEQQTFITSAYLWDSDKNMLNNSPWMAGTSRPSSAELFSLNYLPVASAGLSFNMISAISIKQWSQCILLSAIVHASSLSAARRFICLETDVRTPFKHTHFLACWRNLSSKGSSHRCIHASYGAVLTCLNGCQRFHGCPLGENNPDSRLPERWRVAMLYTVS